MKISDLEIDLVLQNDWYINLLEISWLVTGMNFITD